MIPVTENLFSPVLRYTTGGTIMPVSMTFTAQAGHNLCELCGVNPARLEFDVRSDPDQKREQGPCCAGCAHNLLDALAQTKPKKSRDIEFNT